MPERKEQLAYPDTADIAAEVVLMPTDSEAVIARKMQRWCISQKPLKVADTLGKWKEESSPEEAKKAILEPESHKTEWLLTLTAHRDPILKELGIQDNELRGALFEGLERRISGIQYKESSNRLAEAQEVLGVSMKSPATKYNTNGMHDEIILCRYLQRKLTQSVTPSRRER